MKNVEKNFFIRRIVLEKGKFENRMPATKSVLNPIFLKKLEKGLKEKHLISHFLFISSFFVIFFFFDLLVYN